MRRIATPGGRYPHQIFFEDLGEIDAICLSALRSQGLLPDNPDPVRIDRFIEKQFRCSILYEEFEEAGVLGATAFEPDGRVLAVAVARHLADDTTTTGQCRLRATIAHEAGHGLLHGSLFVDEGQEDFFASQVERGERRILCRGDDVAAVNGYNYRGRWWEYQANYAIGGLLLPKELVRSALAHLTTPADSFGGVILEEHRREAAVRHLTRSFAVSSTVARIRLEGMFSRNVFSTRG